MNSIIYQRNKAFLSSRPLLLFLIVFLCLTAGLGGIEVDREELEKAAASRVIFINYEGPHARFETSEDIWAIGYNLGLAIRAGNTRAGTTNRYFVSHSFDSTNREDLGADIFGLGVDAGVDHIRNLRLILQGYLQGAYEYSAADAALLAQFITIYNAVYRGNWPYFNNQYSDAVISLLQEDKAGLSIRFDEWPGRALIIIPLSSASPASLSAIDTGIISDEQVVEQLRQEEDRAVDTRKDLVDLKEREADETRQSAELQREAIAEEEARLAAERAAQEAERERIAREQERIRQEVAAATDQEAAEREAETQRQELQAAERSLDAREEQLQEQERDLDEQRAEARRTEEQAEAKAEEARADRAAIAEDQQQLIQEQEAARVLPAGLVGISLNSPDAPIGRLVLVNPANGQILQRSVLDTIHARTITVMGSSIIAIAGSTQTGEAIRLVSLESSSLALSTQGSNNIHPNSLLWLNGQDLYALESTEGSVYVSRFDSGLQRRARSAVPVHNHASIHFRDGSLLTQRRDGTVLVLNPQDLSERR